MVNLRYHIVSITAVFLALGIGITMGSSFLGDAAFQQVKTNVRSAERRIDATRKENSDLRAQVDRDEERGEDLTDQAAERIFDERLDDVPIVVIATPGVDESSLDDLTAALVGADADIDGTLVPSDRLALEGDDEVDELSALLDTTSNEPDQLRRLLVNRLAAVLTRAAEPTDGSGDGTSRPPEGTTTTTDPNDTTTTTTSSTTTPPTTEPNPATGVALVRNLVEAGFLDYEPARNGAELDDLLEDEGYRYVVVSGPEPELDDADFVQPLLRAVAEDRPAPVVLASAAAGDDPEAVRSAVVGPVRDDAQLAERVTTVDNLESFPGVAAVILALQDLGRDRRGHYGVGEGATAQLPGTGEN